MDILELIFSILTFLLKCGLYVLPLCVAYFLCILAHRIDDESSIGVSWLMGAVLAVILFFMDRSLAPYEYFGVFMDDGPWNLDLFGFFQTRGNVFIYPVADTINYVLADTRYNRHLIIAAPLIFVVLGCLIRVVKAPKSIFGYILIFCISLLGTLYFLNLTAFFISVSWLYLLILAGICGFVAFASGSTVTVKSGDTIRFD